VTCGNGYGAGTLVVYSLSGSVSGYDLTNITVYGGWKDAGRDQQAYTIYYSTVAAPSTFNLLDTVNYLPADPAGAQSATRVTLTPAAGVLATRVAAIKFDFTSPASENGYCGYSEINVAGVPSPQPVRWAVGNGNWDTNSLNWKLLGGGGAVSYVEGNLAAWDDSASGGGPITVTLTADHAPTILTNNSSKNYTLAGNFALTGGSLIKDGAGTLLLDNAGANAFSGILINSGVLEVGNQDTNGGLGGGKVTNNGALMFDRTDTVMVPNLISGSGSLIQAGAGAVALSATNSYAGATTIQAGTLALVASGAIGASALITVTGGATLDASGRADRTLALNSGQTLKGGGGLTGNLKVLSGATLSPGDTIGAMVVRGNATLSGVLAMELNRTNLPPSDQLASLGGVIAGGGTLVVTNLGPALQPGDRFQLFNQAVGGFGLVLLPSTGPGLGWANNLAIDGSVTVVSTVPPNLAPQLAAGNLLTLSWPADHTGWTLQAQTNTLARGLGANWSVIAASITTNQLTLPVNGTQANVFYRLELQ
jgi:autotransporter-associated beta strand protein